MKKIIAISGKQYSGKDTVAKVLLEKFQDFKRVGIGDSIKIEYGRQNYLTFEQIEFEKHKYRAGLIKLGNEGRAKDPDYWLKSLIALDYNIIVPDIRMPHEIELFKQHGAFALRVEASEEARLKRGIITNSSDSTETSLDNYKGFNYVIENNGSYDELLNSIEPLTVAISNFF